MPEQRGEHEPAEIGARQDAEAITAELKKVLPKRSMADWMIGYNVKSRYLRK